MVKFVYWLGVLKSVTIAPDGGPCKVGGITYGTVTKTLSTGEGGPVIRYQSPSGESEIAADEESLALKCFLADLAEVVGNLRAHDSVSEILSGYAAGAA